MPLMPVVEQDVRRSRHQLVSDDEPERVRTLAGEPPEAVNDVSSPAHDGRDQLVVIAGIVFEVRVLDDDERSGDRVQAGRMAAPLPTLTSWCLIVTRGSVDSRAAGRMTCATDRSSLYGGMITPRIGLVVGIGESLDGRLRFFIAFGPTASGGHVGRLAQGHFLDKQRRHEGQDEDDQSCDEYGMQRI